MTAAQAEAAGDAALGWLRRHAAAIVSLVFASGFAWAQFAAVQAGLDEARGELRELRAELVAFRLSGVGVSRDELRHELAELSARQAALDARQDEALGFYRDRILALAEAVGRSPVRGQP